MQDSGVRGILQVYKIKERKSRLDGNCIDCVYSTKIGIGYLFYACEYLDRVGKRRPCPYGHGCTVKRTIRKKVRKCEEEKQGANVP